MGYTLGVSDATIKIRPRQQNSLSGGPLAVDQKWPGKITALIWYFVP